MFPRLADPNLTAIVSSKLAELSGTDYAQLASLPEVISDTIEIDGRKVIVSVWHDVLETGEHRVVVQADQARLGGILSRVRAEGFAIGPNNIRRSLTDEELSPFA